MTTTDEDQMLNSADGEEQVTDETQLTDDPVDGQEGADANDAGEAAAPAEDEPKQEDPQVKQWRDAANISRGQLATVTRTIKALKDSGVLTDEAIEKIADEQGLDVNAVRSVLSQEPPPANPAAQNARKLMEQFDHQNPGDLKLAMDEAYGEDTQKYFEAFDWLVGADKDEARALGDVPPNKVVAYAIRRGKEVFGEYEELKGSGSVLNAYRALKKGAVKTVQSKQQRVPMNSSTPAPTQPRQPGKSFYDGV